MVIRSRSLTIDPSVARRLPKSLSIKQGIKYDAPESAADIAPFIAFHGLLHLLYKLTGNLEPSRSVPQVTTTTEDWPWFQLAMVSYLTLFCFVFFSLLILTYFV
jgi:hypothetical protein